MVESREHGLTRRELLRRGAIAGGTLAVGPALLAACGTSTVSPSAGASSSAPSPLSTPIPSASSGPKAGGTLKFGVVGNITTFDPYVAATLNYPVIRNLNAFLVDYTDKLEVVPNAAKSWDIAADHTSVTVHLDPNVKFQTGKALTSDDVVFGLQRAQSEKEGGNLLGPMSIVSGFTAPDANTVVINLKKPVADLLITDLLTSFPIVDKSKNTSDSLAKATAGAGAFGLASYSPNATIELKKYADYGRAPLPYLDGASIEVFDSHDTMASGLQSGSIDGALFIIANTARNLGDGFDIVRGYPGTDVNLLRLNPTHPPFDNKLLRQAIQRAVNRDRIVQDVFAGFSAPSVLPFGPNSPAYDPSYEDKLKFDLDAARQLWQQAGSPASGDAIANGSDPQALQILQIIQSDLKQIGFDLRIENQDTQTWIKNLIAGNFGALIGDIGDASKSPSRLTTNSLFRVVNNPLWKDKLPQSYVDAISASEAALTDADAKASSARLTEVIVDEAWGIGINVLLSLFAVRKGVVGFGRDVDDHVLLENAWIS